MRGDGNQFTCACNGTGYGGPTCKIAIVQFAPIPPVTDRASFDIDLSTAATLMDRNELVSVTIEVPGGGNRYYALSLRSSTGVGRQPVQATTNGIMKVILPENSENVMYEPRERTVLVSRGAGNADTYFQQLSLPRGQLKPSCCAADDHVTISCPGATTRTISLLSPCQWSTNRANTVVRSTGTVFAKSEDLALPISISGVRYPRPPGKIDVRPTGNPCEPCNQCQNDDNRQCHCYIHNPQNTLEFLQTRALGYTYMNEIQKLLPSWLNISVDLDLAVDSSQFTPYDLLAPITRSTEAVSSVEGCEKLSSHMGSIFSVLRYDKTLSAIIDDETFTYSERADSEDSDTTMCFAVDMCQGLDSPAHMQISQPVSDILASQFLRQFTSHQWTFVFNTISVFKNAMPRPATRQFWNGVESIKTPDILADVSMDIDAGLVFSDTGLAMRLEFSGTVDTNYEVCS